jgi:hypothetical protein
MRDYGATGLPLDSYLKTINGRVTSGYGESGRKISNQLIFRVLKLIAEGYFIGIILNGSSQTH